MASRDRFNIKLACPSCGSTGVAKAEEADGIVYLKGDRETSITDLPSGFKVVDQPSKMASVDIFCVDCNVSTIL
jgi:hypothetical protein